MRIALIADTFPPLRDSGAVQLRDLAYEFSRQGHMITVLLPSSNQADPWLLKEVNGVQIMRLKAPRTKGTGYFRRTLSEFIMPFSMWRYYRKSPLSNENWDGVIWYSPSIFHGPLVNNLKLNSDCKSYLIIRDIFPEWAVDMGLMKRGLKYKFFDMIARYQYSIADVIGVQTSGNLKYFKKWCDQSTCRIEVLQNWLGAPGQSACPIRLNETPLAGRKVFVYAGNMGVAQGMGIILDLAEKMHWHADLGFLFVGRGVGVNRLRAAAEERRLTNVLFYDEIHPNQIADLYSQCSAGIVALDPRHKSHNIPGKFLTYMQCGLPVLANINPGNDLASTIRDEKVGQVCENNDLNQLQHLTIELLSQIDSDGDKLSTRCRSLFEKDLTVEKSVSQIVSSFEITSLPKKL